MILTYIASNSARSLRNVETKTKDKLVNPIWGRYFEIKDNKSILEPIAYTHQR